MLRNVILALLSDGKPAHGYALVKTYARRSGIGLSIGNVYRELQKLIAAGLIEMAERPRGVDARRVPYRITVRGRDAFAVWLREPLQDLRHAGGDELAHRIAIVSGLDPAQALVRLDALCDELHEQARTLERERERDDRGEPARAVLLGRHARYLDIDLEALEELRAHTRGLCTPRIERRVGIANGSEMEAPR